MNTKASTIPGSAKMSATEVVEWIAFGERRTHQDLIEERRAYEDWCLTLPVAEVLQAAEAMAAFPPFCLWLPLEEDVRACVPREQRRYLHQMGSPCGPRLLDEMCARQTKRLGQQTSYADLAARIVPETSAYMARCEAREAARKRVIKWIVEGQLTAWGRPDGEDGYPDDRAGFVAIPTNMKIEDGLSLEGDRLISSRAWGPGSAGRSYSKLRFHTAEVAALWQASRGIQSASEDKGQLPEEAAPPKRRVAANSRAASDAGLVAEMHALLQSRQAQSPWHAARLVAHRAEGSRHGDSRAKRLLARFQKSVQS